MSLSVELHFLVKKANNQGDDLVGQRCVRPEIGGVASAECKGAESTVGSRENHLTEFVKTKALALLSVKLVDHEFDYLLVRIDVLLLKELHELCKVQAAGFVTVNHLKYFEGLKVWVTRELLAFHLNERLRGCKIAEDVRKHSVVRTWAAGFTG